jgi:hypothetical protein
MNDQIKRQFENMMGAARDARIPDNVQQIAEDTVEKSREAYVKMAAVATDNAKVAEEVMLTAQAGAKSLGEKVLQNTLANTEAAFDAARAIARAKTLPEAFRLQADFAQQQMAVAGQQTKELLELSTKVARHTFETMSTATTKSFEQMKKAG